MTARPRHDRADILTLINRHGDDVSWQAEALYGKAVRVAIDDGPPGWARIIADQWFTGCDGEKKSATARMLAEREGKELCRRCPVRAACLVWALEAGETDGIYGGLTPDERAALTRRGVA